MRITSLVLTLGSLVALAAATGCAAHADNSQTGDDQEVKASGAKEGAMCGGIAGLRCASGLDCVLAGDHPDEAGTCQKSAAPKPGEEGATCGGFAGLTCKSGLSCKITEKAADASGTCEAPAAGEEGGMCGGIAGLPCKSGLRCVMASKVAIDAPGTCSK
jgi:hypothetical protein